MLSFLISNIGTIIVALILVCAFLGIIVSLVRNKKKGKSPCGCSCGKCPMSGTCHKN